MGYNNGMIVNKKKSGILIMNSDYKDNEIFDINGYPIKENYRHLGLNMNNGLNPMTTLFEINNKLNIYVQRGKMLFRQYFTPKSLVLISNYYQKSRIIYGLSCYLDDKIIIDKVEKNAVSFIKIILDLDNGVSSDKLRLAMALPKLEHRLVISLIKNIRKYESHFQEKITIYDEIIDKYKKIFEYDWENTDNVKEIKSIIIKKSIRLMGNKLGIIIGNNFEESYKKNLYKWCDKRDFFLLKFIVNYGYFRERLKNTCPFCEKENNNRNHITDFCPGLRISRIKFFDKLQEMGAEDLSSVEGWIMKIYFDPQWQDKTMRSLMEIVKSFVTQIYLTKRELV